MGRKSDYLRTSFIDGSFADGGKLKSRVSFLVGRKHDGVTVSAAYQAHGLHTSQFWPPTSDIDSMSYQLANFAQEI